MEEQYIDTSVRYEIALKTKSILESMNRFEMNNFYYYRTECIVIKSDFKI
jgi:hypothetical protein